MINKREFNKLCELHYSDGKSPLTNEQKHEMAMFIIKKRYAVDKSLITNLMDVTWLHSMGYLYQDEKLVHTSETLSYMKKL